MTGDGVGKQIGAVPDTGDDEPVTLREFRAQGGRHPPAQAAGYRVAEVAVGPREGHGRRVASELVEDYGVLALLPVEAAAHPGVGREPGGRAAHHLLVAPALCGKLGYDRLF